MSQENIEVVKAVFRAWEQRDPEKAFALLDPSIEVDLTSSVVWGDTEVRHGHDGLRGAVGQLLEIWEDMEFFPEAFIDAGDEVLVWLRITARGRGSGVPTKRHGASVYTVRNGIVTRWRAFETLGEAANEVGI